jgi:DNA-binding cell septation regulator SpoVG
MAGAGFNGGEETSWLDRSPSRLGPMGGAGGGRLARQHGGGIDRSANRWPPRNGDMTVTETAVVTFMLTRLEHASGRGRLLGLADAEVVVEGVTFAVKGIRVVHGGEGGLLVQPPRFRHPDGQWLPAVVLPRELEEAIAAEVLGAFSPGAG